jgi:hypothetical protein
MIGVIIILNISNAIPIREGYEIAQYFTPIPILAISITHSDIYRARQDIYRMGYPKARIDSAGK